MHSAEDRQAARSAFQTVEDIQKAASWAFQDGGPDSEEFKDLEKYFTMKDRQEAARWAFQDGGPDSEKFQYLKEYFTVKDRQKAARRAFQDGGPDSEEFKYLEKYFTMKDRQEAARSAFQDGGLESPRFQYLVRKISLRDEILENEILLAGKVNEIILWLQNVWLQDDQDYSRGTLERLFPNRVDLVYWLLTNQAKMNVKTLLLLLMSKLYGDHDERVLAQAGQCTTRELGEMLMRRGAGDTPPIVFEKLSSLSIRVRFKDRFYWLPEIFRYRSSYVASALRFNERLKEQLPEEFVDLIDPANENEVGDEEIDSSFVFIYRYVTNHPDVISLNGVNDSILKRIRELADMWLVEDLVDSIDLHRLS